MTALNEKQKQENQTISIILPRNLLDEIDRRAEANGLKRSPYIRQSLLLYMAKSSDID